MRQVTLEAKTHAGKNKLAKTADASLKWDGNWNVTEERERVLFSPKPGPWLLLTPAKEDGIIAERLSRWVHATCDDHFIVRSNVEVRGAEPIGEASLSNEGFGG